MTIREIARRMALYRNTIKKYLCQGASEPRFKTPKRPSKPDLHADRVFAWFLAHTRKWRKERRTVKQMHAELVKLKYRGGGWCPIAATRRWFLDFTSDALVNRRKFRTVNLKDDCIREGCAFVRH